MYQTAHRYTVKTLINKNGLLPLIFDLFVVCCGQLELQSKSNKGPVWS